MARGERGARFGMAKELALIPAGRIRAMSPFGSLVGTSLTPDAVPDQKENNIVSK